MRLIILLSILAIIGSCNSLNKIESTKKTGVIVYDSHVHIMSPGLIDYWKKIGIPFSKSEANYSNIDTIMANNPSQLLDLIGMGYVYGNPEYYQGDDAYERMLAENDFLFTAANKYPNRIKPLEIKELKIYASNLDGQIDFYKNVIGLDLIKQSRSEARFKIGESDFVLYKGDEFHSYHFAINIPCNKEGEALVWLKKRVDVLQDGSYEIQDFDSWNAKAIYFYDADNNIVEFIARKNLKNESDEEFNHNSLLEISEIGVPVNDIESTYLDLRKVVDIQKYDGGFERFFAVGDEKGLFIFINKKLKKWFPTNEKAFSSEFEIKFEEKGKKYELEFKNEKIQAIKTK